MPNGWPRPAAWPIVEVMSDDPRDPEILARRFLDLWQEQVAASVADPALAQWLARFMTTQPGAATAGNAAAPAGNAANGQAFADIFAAMSQSYASHGAPASAPASGPGDDRVDELARRLAEFERRLAALESGPGGAGAKSGKRPRKRQT